MDFLARFDISFSGLASGKHLFEFDIDDSFFEHFEHAVVEHARIHAEVGLNKQSTMMMLDFNITGTLTVECARCAESFETPIDLKEHLIVKFGEQIKEDAEDVDIITIPHSETKINVAQQLYEYVSTAMPIRSVHPDDAKGKPTCDKKMLKVLKTISENEKESHKEPDHRWDALLKLKQEGLN